jgi:hypothetical protein
MTAYQLIMPEWRELWNPTFLNLHEATDALRFLFGAKRPRSFDVVREDTGTWSLVIHRETSAYKVTGFVGEWNPRKLGEYVMAAPRRYGTSVAIEFQEARDPQRIRDRAFGFKKMCPQCSS